MVKIPEIYTELLLWIKETTEEYWSEKPLTMGDGSDCIDWIGAKWVGLTDNQIDEIEHKYSIKFMPEHREFLKILHTIDRKEKYKDSDGEIIASPYFYNWLEDETEINEKLNWVFETILFDVNKSRFWLKSWGKRPDSEEDRKIIFSNWFSKTPKLIPITAHTFLVSDIELQDRPLLSVWGSDTVVVGWNLRNYLLSEFCYFLGLTHSIYICKPDYEGYDWENIPEYETFRLKESELSKSKTIPYFEELIMYWGNPKSLHF